MPYLPPSFFIIGERKCATSAVYRYLIDHPQVLPCRVKEPQFFSKPLVHRVLNTDRYRAMFPLQEARKMQMSWIDLDASGQIVTEELIVHADPGRPVITGEASANTFAQVPPERLHQAFPQAKLILCLRHPVDRAYSHHKMLLRFAEEGRRLPFKPKEFKHDFDEDIKRVSNGGQGYFAGVSLYADRLSRWLEMFGNESIHIIRSEDLDNADTASQVMTKLCEFLDIDEYDFAEILGISVNRTGKGNLAPDLRAKLYDFYLKDVEKLEAITGRQFHWNP